MSDEGAPMTDESFKELAKRLPPMQPMDRDAFVVNVTMKMSRWELPGYSDDWVLAFDAIRLESGRIVGEWKQERSRHVTHEPQRYICWMRWPEIPAKALEIVP